MVIIAKRNETRSDVDFLLGCGASQSTVASMDSYLRARYYDPGTGRFDKIDPFAGSVYDPQSLHKYAYVHGDPINAVDPSGEFIHLLLGALALLLLSPNPANAPGPGDSTYGGTDALGVNGIVGIATGPLFVVAGKIASPLIETTYHWIGTQVNLVFGRTASLSFRGNSIGNYTFFNPGPLADDVAATFSGGRYAAVNLTDDVVLYRAWGGKAREFAGFWTTAPPRGSIQSQIDSALLPQWGNAATRWTAVRVPRGNTVFVGETGFQGGAFVGGTPQVLIQGGVQSSWKIGTGALK